MAYFVPRSDWDKVELVLKTDASALSALADTLYSAAPAKSTEELLNTVELPSEIRRDEAEQLLAFCKQLTIIAWLQGDALADLFSGVATYFGSVPAFTNWDPQAWQERTPSLERLLHPDGPIFVMAKADALKSEYSSVVVTTRVLSDSRYVFDEPGEKILGALATQTLVIEYYDLDYGRKKQLFSMDSLDIKRLLEQLSRASKKQEAISSTFLHTDIKDLTP